MFKLTFIVSCLVFSVNCWKPIVDPSISLTQRHPALSAPSKSILLDTSASSLSSIGTGFGSEKYDSPLTALFSHPLTSGNAGLTAPADDEASARILSGSSYFNGLHSAAEIPAASAPVSDQCSVDKYAFEYEGTVEYDLPIPKLDQFSICTWMRFTNHTADHTVLTYAVDDEPREIQFWVSNTVDSSYFTLAVHGQSLYRLNYPLKMRVWHHACTSWNGKTGEWQLWIKSERVGRGFHNRLVGHDIRPHGKIYSGGPSPTGPVCKGLHMELTMIQLYKVALSAGKAHRDHKHHHVHQFDHNGQLQTSTAPPPPPPPPNQPANPLLANGQIATRLRINLAGASEQNLPSPQAGQGIPVNFVSGQFNAHARYTSEQLAGRAVLSQTGPQSFPQQTRFGPTPAPAVQSKFTFPSASTFGSSFTSPSYSSAISSPSSSSSISFSSSSLLSGSPGSSQFIDNSFSTNHGLFKRAATKPSRTVKATDEKKQIKRALVLYSDGSIVDDTTGGVYDFDGLAQFGDNSLKQHITKMMDLESEIKEYDREPAEGEVQAVMNLCSLCDHEPFEGAVVMTWKQLRVRVKHALKGRSVGGCGQF